MTRSFALGCVWMVAVMALGGAGRVYAQDAPAAGQPAPDPPAKPAFHGSVSIGGAIATGVQEQKSFQLDASVERPFSDGGRFVAAAARQYQNVTFPSASLLADRTTFAVGADQNLTKYTTIMARSLYLQDTQLKVNSRYEELFGYGLHLYDKTKKKIDFQLIPGVSFYNENLVYASDEGWKSGYGLYEKLSIHLDKVWSIDNSFRVRKDFSVPDRSIESVASIQGMVTKAVGIQFEYQYNYESIVPPGFPNYLSIVIAGLKFQF